MTTYAFGKANTWSKLIPDNTINTVYLLIGWTMLLFSQILIRLSVHVIIFQCLEGRKGPLLI